MSTNAERRAAKTLAALVVQGTCAICKKGVASGPDAASVIEAVIQHKRKAHGHIEIRKRKK